LYMHAEQALIKAIAREQGSGTEHSREIKRILAEHSIDWDLFKQLIIYHQLFPLAYSNLKDFTEFLPQGLSAFLKNNSYATLQRAHYLWREFTRIANAFAQSKVELVPIKGIAFLADIYQDTFFRPMVDIDILVQETDLLKAEAILYDLGHKKELRGLREEYWRENQYHIAFLKNNTRFMLRTELHWALDYKRKRRHLLPEIWQRLKEVQYDGKKIKSLSAEDTLFSLALHCRRFGENLCLKNVYDAILLMRKYKTNFDWDYCLAMSEKYEMRVTLFFLLEQMWFLSGQDIPEYVFTRLNISGLRKKIIRMFIEKNTFSIEKIAGSKDIYLKLHFLLYDSILEPLAYIMDIPQEQFAKFYGLKVYSNKTEFFYRWRLLYIFFKSASNLLRSFLYKKRMKYGKIPLK